MKRAVKEILKEYEGLRTRGENERKARVEEVYEKVPSIKKIDNTISKLGVECTYYCINLAPREQTEYLEAFGEKIKKLKEKKAALLKENGYPLDYMDIKYQCQRCKDTGYIERDRCSCFKQRLIERAYSLSNLSNVLSRENFSTFDLNLFPDEKFHNHSKTPRQNMLDILSRCEGFVYNFEKDNGENLLFYGETGLGKTFLCNCIAKKLLDKGKPVLYLTAFKLFKILEEHQFGPKGVTSERNMLDFILTGDLLIIDDLGTELTNSFTICELFNIVNTRLLERNKTIISTNLQPSQLMEVYTQRLFSRLSAHYTALEFYGHDLRM